MKALMFLLILTTTLSYGQSVQYKAKEIHSEGVRLQSDLKSLLQNFHQSFKSESNLSLIQKKTILQALVDSYKNLQAVNGETQNKPQLAPSQLASLNKSLTQLQTVAGTASLSYQLGNSLESWLFIADRYANSVRPLATLAEDETTVARVESTQINIQSLAQQQTSRPGVNQNTNLVVETTVPGLETPEDRVKFVEEITRQNAAFSRSLTNAQSLRSDVRINPPEFPSAYLYSNGTPGNLSNLGRRDTLVPLFNNRQRVTPKRRKPIRIRIGD